MTMTTEEIMSFQGHEFTYVFEDDDTMPAYIKKIDLAEELLTYWSFSLVTDTGHKFTPLNDEEETEGACCLGKEDTLAGIIKILTEIKNTGKYLPQQTSPGFFAGCPF